MQHSSSTLQKSPSVFKKKAYILERLQAIIRIKKDDGYLQDPLSIVQLEKQRKQIIQEIQKDHWSINDFLYDSESPFMPIWHSFYCANEFELLSALLSRFQDYHWPEALTNEYVESHQCRFIDIVILDMNLEVLTILARFNLKITHSHLVLFANAFYEQKKIYDANISAFAKNLFEFARAQSVDLNTCYMIKVPNTPRIQRRATLLWQAIVYDSEDLVRLLLEQGSQSWGSLDPARPSDLVSYFCVRILQIQQMVLNNKLSDASINVLQMLIEHDFKILDSHHESKQNPIFYPEKQSPILDALFIPSSDNFLYTKIIEAMKKYPRAININAELANKKIIFHSIFTHLNFYRILFSDEAKDALQTIFDFKPNIFLKDSLNNTIFDYLYASALCAGQKEYKKFNLELFKNLLDYAKKENPNNFLTHLEEPSQSKDPKMRAHVNKNLLMLALYYGVDFHIPLYYEYHPQMFVNQKEDLLKVTLFSAYAPLAKQNTVLTLMKNVPNFLENQHISGDCSSELVQQLCQEKNFSLIRLLIQNGVLNVSNISESIPEMNVLGTLQSNLSPQEEIDFWNMFQAVCEMRRAQEKMNFKLFLEHYENASHFKSGAYLLNHTNMLKVFSIIFNVFPLQKNTLNLSEGLFLVENVLHLKEKLSSDILSKMHEKIMDTFYKNLSFESFLGILCELKLTVQEKVGLIKQYNRFYDPEKPQDFNSPQERACILRLIECKELRSHIMQSPYLTPVIYNELHIDNVPAWIWVSKNLSDSVLLKALGAISAEKMLEGSIVHQKKTINLLSYLSCVAKEKPKSLKHVQEKVIQEFFTVFAKFLQADPKSQPEQIYALLGLNACFEPLGLRSVDMMIAFSLVHKSDIVRDAVDDLKWSQAIINRIKALVVLRTVYPQYDALFAKEIELSNEDYDYKLYHDYDNVMGHVPEHHHKKLLLFRGMSCERQLESIIGPTSSAQRLCK